MLRIVNLVLIIVVIANCIKLVNQCYQTRVKYAILEKLKNQNKAYENEYTQLELEEGTFASNLIIKDFAIDKLGLVQADKNHIIIVN